MVQKLSYTANSITLGTGTSKVVLGADSGNLIVKDSDANTSILEPGLGVQGASAVTTYANPGALPFSPISSAGSLAYTTSTGALYMSNGSGWYKITMINTAPSITLSSTTASPTKTALTLDFTYTVTEPEGTPTSITLANSGIATTGNVAITHTTSNNHVRLVFDGTTEYAGDATVTLTVTDGVNTGTGTITIDTSYYESTNTRYNSLVLKTKTNSVALSTAQKSLYFDGTGDYLTSTFVDTAGTGQFTAEAFFYAKVLPTSGAIMTQRAQSITTGNYAQWIVYVQSNGNLGWYNGVSGQRVVETGAGGVVANRWYHVAITRNSSNVMTMWKDGVSVGTRSNQQQNWNYSPFSVGANGDGTAPFNGFISNVRWTPGTAIYTSNFIVPTSPLTALSNTKFLVAQGTTTDNSGEGETVTTAGDVTASDNSPFESGNNITPTDASTSSHTFTVGGTTTSLTTFSPYRDRGYAVNFQSGWSKIKNATFAFGTGDYTIEGWIYPHGTGNCDVIDLRSSGFNQGVALTLKGNNLIWPYYGGSQFTTGTIPVLPNVWSHLALVRTSGTLKAFVNGQEDFSVSDTNNRSGTSSTDHAIGANYGGASQFDGELYDWRVTNNAVYTGNFVPPTEPLTTISGTMLHLCRGPRIADYSSNAYVLEPQGGGNSPTQVAHTPFDRENAYSESDHGGSATFPGTSDEIKTNDASTNQVVLGSGDFTVEFWIYKHNAADSTWEALISQNYAGTGGWRIYKNSGSGQLRWYAGSTDTLLSSSDSYKMLTTKAWYHAAIVRSSGTLTIYVNGKASGSISSHTYNYTGGTNGEIEIGKGTVTSTYPTDANIADVRIVSGTAVYTGEFTPPTGPLTKTGGTYSSTTNVNTSIPDGHTKLLLNMTSAKIKDVSQTQSNVTLVGETAPTSEQRHFSENTIDFPGTSDYITISDQPEFKAGQPFCIDGWHYIDARSNYSPCIFGNYNSHSTGSLGLFAGHGSSTTTQYQLSQNGSFPAFNAGTVAYNQWVHFAVQRNLNEKVQVYIGGTQQGSDVASAMALGGVGDNFFIGTAGDAIANSSLDGKLHDFRISENFTRYPYYSAPVTLTTTNSGMTKPDGTTPSVTASNVLLLTCHAGTEGSQTITDGSTHNLSITVNGNAAVSNFAPGTGMKSVYFDGTGDYLQCTLTEAPGTSDWTLEYWVYHNNIDDNDIHCAFGTYSPAFYYRNGSNAFAYYSGTHNTNITPVAHKWYHMVYSHDATSNRMRVFVDGAFIEESTYNGNINSTTFRIGDDSTSAWMDGYISNLRLVKGQVLYSNNFTPSTSPLE